MGIEEVAFDSPIAPSYSTTSSSSSKGRSTFIPSLFFGKRRFLWYTVLAGFLLFLIFSLYQHSLVSLRHHSAKEIIESLTSNLDNHHQNNNNMKLNSGRSNIDNNNNQLEENSSSDKTLPSNVTQSNSGGNNFHPFAHIFYYAWYKNEKHDKKYEHWNHKVLPHWTASTNEQYKHLVGKEHDPKLKQLATNFYPSRGAYSSTDKDVVMEQFLEIKNKANVHVIVLSWWGVSEADENGSNTELITPFFMECAEEAGLQVIFHMEPYKGRNAASVKRDIKYVIDKYGNSKAFFRHNGKPLFYMYDSYILSAEEWKTILSPNGKDTIRNTKYDSIIIGLYLNSGMRDNIKNSFMDGFYTYFAADQFTEGSTCSKWQEISEWAHNNNLLFIPSIAPGYIDEKIRPWNKQNTKGRENGQYYQRMFDAVLNLKHFPQYITITSYNEWHEGTQIEPAIPITVNNPNSDQFDNIASAYLDYSPKDPDFYLTKTRENVNKIFKL
ncbi:hypothetical protein NAEGRDRAFT_62591 [Naegleria gruberi]|uniref:Uncharacterized protein FM155 n=1 Tax=Naegleria gruberi TaxID=5762 RepID=D2V1I4_NAEGR|nr:uncharacterized protein NAEGRDRAFT_62591 [Naegleria gruberi]EFC49314.1 hypothetical protein NAEGRDRAFT_62591 [Naegleria gruberi]|eukprot:XP_002682058.1 hypothetical protein NAEGRDRAFT_62591 [Naegleria gruberi strain NEG-M]